jgi:lysophospholipid acyltransferase (LPLAT)-like uncharacterized protein
LEVLEDIDQFVHESIVAELVGKTKVWDKMETPLPEKRAEMVRRSP